VRKTKQRQAHWCYIDISVKLQVFQDVWRAEKTPLAGC
jgi:hypothetical protein